tara:strand:- start:11926 stop:12648 length:723 start_codon:yes stop_codon:yes gene_type:complete
MLDKGVERRGPPKPAGAIANALTLILRLILPVAALLAAFAMLWLLRAEVPQDLAFIEIIDPALVFSGASVDPWLNWSMVLLPVVFFIINLISRRYGPSAAMLGVVVSWLVLGGVIQWALSQGHIEDFESGIAPVPHAIAFAAALFGGQVLCVYFFEWLRGIPWWEAPLVAALVGGICFTFLHHVLLFWLTHDTMEGLWSGPVLPRLIALSVLQLIWSVGQLLPTAILRGIIRPLPGLGGA